MSVLRLIQFTDPHLYGSEAETLRGIATLPALKAALCDAQQSSAWPPDVVLVTGDLVQDDPSGYVHIRHVFGHLGMPVLCIPGNHDDPAVMRRELRVDPFTVGGLSDFDAWRIVLLDSALPGSASGRLSQKMLAQLETALSTAGGRHCLVTLHHHPVAMSSRWLDRVGLENAEEFFNVIDRHDNVRAIVWGHVHQSYDGMRKDVRLLATPSTCAQFVPHADEFAVDRRPPAYRTLELQSDGSLLTEVVWVEKTRRWLFALGLLGSITAHAGSPVWAIHGDHNTVYLAGSVHLLKADDSRLPPAFDHAYSGSKAIVMELAIDKLDPSEAASWMMEHGMLAEGTTLRATIGDDRYRRVTAEVERLGIPMEAADMLQPWALGLQLIEMQYMQLGFDPQQGVEQQLQHRAQADGKPIRGLETMDEQLGVLQGMSYPDQARFLDMIVTEMRDVESETQSVVTAWRTGDAAKLSALLSDEYKSFPNLYRLLVSDRNKRWVPQIEKLLQGNQDCFVVVGALHLVGDGGLLELMRRDGYKAEVLN